MPIAVAPPTRFALPLVAGAAGVLHLARPEPFVRIVPPWLPEPRLLVAASGVALLIGAVGLCVTAARRASAWGLIALLAAVLPANVQMLHAARAAHAPAGWQLLLWLRLPLQGVLAWWVWRDALRPEPGA